ncbi:MAG: hypothetical protein CNLJKLNK_01354 [Holosporales bacterium]
MINFLLSFFLLISSVVADVGIDPSAMHQTVSLHCVEKINDQPKGTKNPGVKRFNENGWDGVLNHLHKDAKEIAELEMLCAQIGAGSGLIAAAPGAAAGAVTGFAVGTAAGVTKQIGVRIGKYIITDANILWSALSKMKGGLDKISSQSSFVKWFEGRVGQTSVPIRSAESAADALRLKTELAFKEANILTYEGKLTQEAIQGAKKISLKDDIIKNPKIVQELTKDGSNIADWAKYKTESVSMPNGQSMQIHFYKNDKTGRIDYVTKDFKVKGDVGL